MKLKDISDQQLLNRTKALIKKEQIIIGEIIGHLEEIEIRKLYCDLKYDSIYSYCIFELGYSKDQAYRRISAMRLTRTLPEIKTKIEQGRINLSSANMLATLIHDGDMNKKEQVRALRMIDGKSKSETSSIIETIRETKGIVRTKKRVHIKKETQNSVRMSVSLSKNTMDKINRVKGLYGHQGKELEEVLDMMADALLEKHEEKLRPKKASSKKDTKGRYIRRDIKHSIYKRAGGKCELCGSTHKLEHDHIIPHASSGANRAIA